MRFYSILLATLVICSCFTSCCADIYQGIKIGHTLHEQLTRKECKQIKILIQRSLKSESTALNDLMSFKCGGAAGCYDLGSIIAQIVFNLGENEMVLILTKHPEINRNELEQLLEVGLEYGFNLEEKVPNKTVDRQFPVLFKFLKA